MVSTKLLLTFFAAGLAWAEVHPLTLAQTLELAARQNPDVVLARLDQQHAEQGIRVAHDPFVPKVYGGSGLAYTDGYPNSIDGNAPSIFEAKTDMAIYNRPKSFAVASAKETARGAQIGAQAKSEEIAYRAGSLFLDARQAAHEAGVITTQLPSLRKVVETMEARVNEGSELPVELKRVKVSLAVAQQRLDAVKADQDYAEMLLAVTVGFPAADRVRAVDSAAIDAPVLQTEDDSVQLALKNSKDLRQLQSAMVAKELEMRGYGNAARLPQVNLVAQYSLFARYNYENYFRSFQRNNGQIGVSVTVPLLIGSASSGYAQQTATDLQKLRVQMNQMRDRIAVDTRRSYQNWKKAESARDLSRMQLDLAREDLSVLLAKNSEGRALMSQVEQARVAESDRWLLLYEAETQVERTRLAILRQTGNILAAAGVRSEDGDAHP